ncbi:MAG: adenylate/guanylate cyclase domain-containing protein [Bdellovibrionaceae bacterium]|nr:adenylate/guanylate cyclase domain-containing protein [Pseudobdellovibrionaceae bacterium]
MNFITQRLGFLASPAAIGIITSLAISFTAFFYFSTPEDSRNENTVFNFLEIIHQKSFDLRLEARGPRAVSPQVALLAVDEEAVNTIARWPWPRQLMAKALDRAVELGAKVISFDIVFSEESATPAKDTYENVTQKLTLTSEQKQAFENELKSVDSDFIFSQTILKRQDNFVLGTFFDGTVDALSQVGYPNACFHFIYEQSPPFQVWDNEEYFLAVSDAYEFYFSDFLADAFKMILQVREDEVRSQFPEPKNKREASQLNEKILSAKFNFCENWLDSESDSSYEKISSIWPLAKEEDEDLTEKTYDEWVSKITHPSIYLKNPVPFVARWAMNIDQLSKNTKHTGFFNADLDSDGTIRRSQLVIRSGNAYMPSIALKAYLLANNYNAEIQFDIDEKQSGEAKKIAKFNIVDNETGDEVFSVPVDKKGRLLINYAGPEKMFPHVSMAEMLNPHEDMFVSFRKKNKDDGTWSSPERVKVNKKEFLKDKIFILGATAIGIYDLRVTPFDENFPGAETHVNVIDNLVRRDFLRTHPDEDAWMWLILVVFGIILSFVISRLGAITSFIVSGGTLTAVLYIDKTFFFERGVVTTIVFPLVLVSVIYVVLTFYKYFTEERKKKELKGTFAKYVSPAIVEEVLKAPGNLELGGRKQRMTVFFSDIRGFTTISEALTPEALTELLNRYLTPMTDIVFDNKGTLDKYMGDAVMAFFGAPIFYEEHAKYGCRAALKSLEKLTVLQKEFKEQGLPYLDIGIGLNTGDMNVGNMGSETVRSYTVMGDAVNLGSRLEGINKQYGTRIIISEFTYNDIEGDFICREIDWVKVKGKTEPVRIFELMSEEPLPEVRQNMVNEFCKGFKTYHEKNFQEALDCFKNGLELQPEDKLCQIYIERCEGLIQNPPEEDWDGVFTMTSK